MKKGILQRSLELGNWDNRDSFFINLDEKHHQKISPVFNNSNKEAETTPSLRSSTQTPTSDSSMIRVNYLKTPTFNDSKIGSYHGRDFDYSGNPDQSISIDIDEPPLPKLEPVTQNNVCVRIDYKKSKTESETKNGKAKVYCKKYLDDSNSSGIVEEATTRKRKLPFNEKLMKQESELVTGKLNKKEEESFENVELYEDYLELEVVHENTENVQDIHEVLETQPKSEVQKSAAARKTLGLNLRDRDSSKHREPIIKRPKTEKSPKSNKESAIEKYKQSIESKGKNGRKNSSMVESNIEAEKVSEVSSNQSVEKLKPLEPEEPPKKLEEPKEDSERINVVGKKLTLINIFSDIPDLPPESDSTNAKRSKKVLKTKKKPSTSTSEYSDDTNRKISADKSGSDVRNTASVPVQKSTDPAEIPVPLVDAKAEKSNRVPSCQESNKKSTESSNSNKPDDPPDNSDNAQNVNHYNNNINIILQLDSDLIKRKTKSPKKLRVEKKQSEETVAVVEQNVDLITLTKSLKTVHTQTDDQSHKIKGIIIKDSVLQSPVTLEDGAVEKLFFEENILIVVQEKAISFFECERLKEFLTGSTSFVLIDRFDRKLFDDESDVENNSRICYNDNSFPIYLEMRGRQRALEDPVNMCPMASMYCQIYYLDAKKIKLSSVQVDTVKSLIADVRYTIVPRSCYFLISWNERQEDNTFKTGICKYNLTPDLSLAKLASIRQFPALSYKVNRMSCIEVDKLITMGDTEMSIFNYQTGDLLMSMDLILHFGVNLAVLEYSKNYVFMVRVSETINDKEKILKVIGMNKSDSNNFKIIHQTVIPLSDFYRITSSSITSTHHLIVTFDHTQTLLINLQNFTKIFIGKPGQNTEHQQVFVCQEKIITTSELNWHVDSFVDYFNSDKINHHL